MRMKKAGESGEVAQYISRTQAVRRLQLSLPDFRRLCILKGIYPREPKHRKKVGKGNSALKTYYFVKDIAYLAHEPLIKKFRDIKVFLRKLKKAKAKKQETTIERLQNNEPTPTIDHIIRERYPTFIDAVRDLDDALCMVFLFASMPQENKVKNELLAKCGRLSAEFLHYVIATRGLRKVFLSIKGIYYQADVMGQPVTWIAPYQFSTTAPGDVDFRIMETFLHLYTTVLGFSNFRLYKSLNLQYPPRPVEDDGDRGLVALATQPLAPIVPVTTPTAGASSGDVAARVKTLPGALTSTAAQEQAQAQAQAEDAALQAAKSADAPVVLDSFPDQMEGGEAVLAEAGEIQRAAAETDQQRHLFDHAWVFLSREVPRYSLEFVVAACGGKVSWAGVGGVGGGPFPETDPRITHHVVDRPVHKPIDLKRHYVQPQWVYDCVNAKQLLETAPYAPGAALPAHLSPFVSEGADDYVPPERTALAQRTADVEADDGDVGAPTRARRAAGSDDDDDDDSSADEDEDGGDAMAVDSDDDEAVYRAEMALELKGVTEFPEKSAKATSGKKKAAAAAATAPTTAAKPAAAGKKAAGKAKKNPAAEQAAEEKELAKIMMPKKHKRLYQRIMYTKEKKEQERENLQRKRKAHDESAASAAPAAKKAKVAK